MRRTAGFSFMEGSAKSSEEVVNNFKEKRRVDGSYTSYGVPWTDYNSK